MPLFLNKNRGIFGNSNQFAEIWAYQDFAAGEITATTVILTANENGDNAFFHPSKISGGSAAIFRSDDLEAYVYTGSIPLFSSKVYVDSLTVATITLSGIPHSSYPVRIWYLISASQIPNGYTRPPLVVSSSMLEKLSPILVTQDEIVDNLLSTDATKVLSANQGNVLFTTKEPNITAGATSQFWRGDKTFQTLNAAALTDFNSAADARITNAIGDSVQAHDDVLDDLSALVNGADKGLFFNGTDSFDTFDFSSFSRSLQANATAATWRAALGLGSADNVVFNTAVIEGILAERITVTDNLKLIALTPSRYLALDAANDAISLPMGDLISSQVLGASSATITFSSIPSTYRHLILRCNVRTDGAVATRTLLMNLNGDGGANYNNHLIQANNATPEAGGNLSQTFARIATVPAASADAGYAADLVMTFPFYANTAFNKNFNVINHLVTPTAANCFTKLVGGSWNNTTAISSIVFSLPVGANFITGSSFYLYGAY